VRALFWTDWFLPSIGGVEVFSARLLPDLTRRGHKIVVVAGHHQAGLPDETDWDGVTVRRFPFHPVLAAGDMDRMTTTLLQVARLKRELQPDLVHLNTLGPSVLFHLETSGRCPAPVLLTMHSPVMDDAVRLDTLYGRALRSANWVNCNSKAVRADLCSRLPQMCERSSVTYYGMDAPPLHPSVRPREDPVVLGFGRLVRDKGFDLAVTAFALVVRRFPRARLVLAGDGAARSELEQLVAKLGLSNSVRFLGAVAPERVPGLLNDASLVIVPSRWNEPFGLVALEAALMARPVVAARVGGLAEAVEHGKTGLLVEREDIATMADAMLYLLANYRIADRIGATARERARERFSWNRCVDEYERLYDLTCHGRLMEAPDD